MDDVKAKLKVPAIGLMIVGAANFFTGLVYAIGLLRLDFHDPSINPEVNSIVAYMILILAGVVVLSILFGPLIFWGGRQMLKGRSQRWAKAAAILSLLPIAVCSNPLGIAFGVWALAVLSNEDVKAYFDGENIP